MSESPPLSRLISTARHQYGGRWLESGEEFYATERDARELIILGFAKRKTQTDQRRIYRRRDMKAE